MSRTSFDRRATGVATENRRLKRQELPAAWNSVSTDSSLLLDLQCSAVSLSVLRRPVIGRQLFCCGSDRPTIVSGRMEEVPDEADVPERCREPRSDCAARHDVLPDAISRDPDPADPASFRVQ